MAWAAWAKHDEKALAAYVLPTVADEIRLASPTADRIAAGDIDAVVRELYEAFFAFDLRWSRALYHPDDALQNIRPPAGILHGSGDATCLDLALLFAGAALGKELLPLVVVLDGHALVAVSRTTERRRVTSGMRVVAEGPWVETGVLTEDDDPHAVLVDSERYVLVECTGFARDVGVLEPGTPEAEGRVGGRVGGRMPFERALAAGRAQLDRPDRPYRVAVDIAYLQDVAKIAPHDPVAPGLELVHADLRVRLRELRESYDVLAGRQPQLERLDRFLAEPPGYLLVTGDLSTGKTALLNGWIDRLEKRGDVDVVYHFINRSFGTADRQDDVVQSLLQQAYGAWRQLGRRADGSLGQMEAAWLQLLDVRQPPPGPVVVVIDGVDEALGWRLTRTFFPSHLPNGVHVVVSARAVAGTDWVAALGLDDAEVITLHPLDDDAATELARALGAPAWLLEPDALAVLVTRAEGDALYLRLLVEQLREGPARTPEELSDLKVGLSDAVSSWWDDLRVDARDTAAAQDILRYLTVTRAPITRDELLTIDPDDSLGAFAFDDAVERVGRWLSGDPDVIGLSLSHLRLRDLLIVKFGEADVRRATDRVVAWCDEWSAHPYRYVLTKGFAHRLALLEHATPAQEPALRAAAVTLGVDADYQRARVEKFEDTTGLLVDLGRLVSLIAVTDPPAVNDLVVASLEWSEARAAWLRPEYVFELARSGRIDEAMRRLSLLSADEQWTAAATLAIAWLARVSDPPRVMPLVDNVAVTSWQLALLAARVRAVIEFGSAPPLVMPQPPFELPAYSDLAAAAAAVRRLGGQTTEGLGASGLRAVEDLGDDGPVYLADADAPIVVAAARDDSDRGDALLAEYIDLQAANPYADYRNRSLWAILSAVACLPDPVQTFRHVIDVATGAFAPSPVRFAEALRADVLARQGRVDAEARESFRTISRSLLQRATAPAEEHVSDQWSHVRRRLAAHAEAVAALDGVLAGQLLDAAMALPEGFSGYQAPADLYVAEANLLVRPGHADSRQHWLREGLRAVHNVQDPSFCARLTAGINAILRWWERPPHDIAAAITRFSDNPRAREFAPVHVVGDTYEGRVTADHLPIDRITAARTLEKLAASVFHLPVASFERLNPGVDRAEPLEPGVEVAVPDPGFQPVVAARLSALVLAAPLPGSVQAELVAALVPAAVPNPTLLDTVLARLVRVAPEVNLGWTLEASYRVDTVEPARGYEYEIT